MSKPSESVPENMAAARSHIDAYQVRVELVGRVENRTQETEQDHQDDGAHANDREPVLGKRPRQHHPRVAGRDDLTALGQYVDVDLCTVDRLGWGAVST